MLTAESGRWRILRYDTPARDAMGLCYYLSVRNMNEEDRQEFDGHCSVTYEMMTAWEKERRDERMSAIMELGEVATVATMPEGGEDSGRPE